jgi:hypothetical protein
VDTDSRKAPPTRDRRQITISRLMTVVAITAVVLGVIRSLSVWSPFGIVIGSLMASILMIGRDFLDGIHGIACPYCGRPGMARVAVRPFGYHYYRCSHCHARRKRAWFGPWEDAVSARDQAVFARRQAEGRWEPGPDLEFNPDPGASTHGRLLRGKWERRLQDPHAPARDLPEPEEPARPPGVPSWGSFPSFKSKASDPDWDVEL